MQNDTYLVVWTVYETNCDCFMPIFCVCCYHYMQLLLLSVAVSVTQWYGWKAATEEKYASKAWIIMDTLLHKQKMAAPSAYIQMATALT